MNMINLEEHNQIDDLRIARALSGLTSQQVEQLQRLVSTHENDAETAKAFSEFDECVALVDLWLAERSPAKLDAGQRHKLVQHFAGQSPARVPDKRLTRTPPTGRWFWMLAVSAAAACLVLGSLVWISRPDGSLDNVLFSAAELRKQMLADPPDDMLRWKIC